MKTGARAKKSLGQHWLTDGRTLSRIADAVGIQEGETVIEVGPGRGALTRLLAGRASRLILVELDRDLAAALRERYADDPTVSVLEEDVMQAPVAEILASGDGRLPYVVAGNLPYYIGSAIVRKFLAASPPPDRLVVLLQAEVAERMAAGPGQMSYLAVETQLFAEPKVLFRVPPRAFSPPPKVQSALLRLEVKESPEVEVDDTGRFLELVQAGFAAPRKRLRNSLAVGLRIAPAVSAAILRAARVSGDLRPQMLDITDWRAIYFAWRRSGEPGRPSE